MTAQAAPSLIVTLISMAVLLITPAAGLSRKLTCEGMQCNQATML